MYNVSDDALVNFRPPSLSEDDFKEELEKILTDGNYHSDEVSETDDEKVAQEKNQNARPKNKDDTDHHVLRVYDKPWRSRRVSKQRTDIWFSYFTYSLLLL